MNIYTRRLFGACFLMLAFPAILEAALIERGSGLIYDDVLDVTWLADANWAGTSGTYISDERSDGGMYWADAMTWVENLTYTDTVRNVVYDDWRLPTALNIDGSGPGCGSLYNCDASELGHMFYNNLGGVARTSIANVHNDNYDLFTNIRTARYWNSDLGDLVFRESDQQWYQSHWFFRFSTGHQATDVGPDSFWSWAVRDGDVALTGVPVPAALWLFASGLLGLIGTAGRKRR